MDPRIFQITALAGLLIYGMGWLEFEIGAAQAAVTLGGVLLTQWPSGGSACRTCDARS